MKKLLSVFIGIMLLSGCSSDDEERFSRNAESMMKERYGVESKVSSIKEAGAGSIFVILVAWMVTDDFEAEMVTEDEHVIKFTAYGNNDENQPIDDNFIEKKHEYLLKHDGAYKQTIQSLKNNGLDSIEYDSGTTDGAAAHVHIKASYDGRTVDVERMVNDFNTGARKIVGKKHYEISLSLSTTVKTMTSSDYDGSENAHIYTPTYAVDSLDEFKQKLAQQFGALHAQKTMTQEFLAEFEKYEVTASSDLKKVEHEDLTVDLYEHHVRMYVQQPYNADSLLKAFELLNKAGMEDTTVSLSLDKTGEIVCKASDIQKLADLEKCY
ncbi:hypothetical protein ACFQPF_09670 [Fictibacillus iocasae]|uniref:DUF1672 domain-containing protein n=1 Tax=Fictibacillus iocasae TaxID=2715437 RepID=A0ABW2NRI1_9BACL